MKKITLFILALVVVSVTLAQNKPAKVKPQAIPYKAVKEQILPAQTLNPLANSKSALAEVVIGNTVYDMQTNGSVDTRINIFPDGTIGTAWIRGPQNSAERGTGYNYFDGTAWGDPPTARIEDERTGWPSYAPLGPSGEIVIAHLNDGLKISKRATKGTGPWSFSTLFGPPGATDISWPRIITNGPDHNYVHMVLPTYVAYEGLDLALLYYRSMDGGQTWDKNAVILPQLTSADYDGFNGDETAWGTPHGDTIYFAVSGPWVDTFIMVSPDNGNTWTKIPVLSNANKKLPSGTSYVPPFTMSDGSVAVELDNHGVFHLAFGIGGGYMDGGTKYIFVNSNGLVYWNSTMPMVTDSLDLDVLEANGQLLGAVYNGPDPGDTLNTVPSYRVGLTSMPQISIDDYNNLFFTWAAATPGDPSPDGLNYRHINGRAKFHDKANMTDIIDFNNTIFYLFYEFVYPALAKEIRNDKLSLVYQTSDQPGSNIVNTSIPVHDNNIEYREIPISDFWPVGTEDKTAVKPNQVSQNFPNPANGSTTVKLSLTETSEVTITLTDVASSVVNVIHKGILTSGNHLLKISTENLASGIYFYTVTMGSEKVTRKMIVE